MKGLSQHFWGKVKKTEKCWLWTGAKTSAGYGEIGLKGKIVTTHRLSWELHYGLIGEGQCVLHKCDTRNCVNPKHLFLGTLKDNAQDMVSKGRHKNTPRFGEDNNLSKLTRTEVSEIRKLSTDGLSHREIGRMKKVAHSTVGRIIRNETWKI